MVDPENAEGVTGTGIGLAPIGHKVTIVTPQEVTINISAKVTPHAGYAVGQLQTSITQALAEYIQSLKQSWADETDQFTYVCDVFVSRVMATIIGVPGVSNVSDVKLNGSAADILLTQNSQIQQLPKLGEVNLNV